MSPRKTEQEIQIEKLPTGIAGFDDVTEGGLPKGRTTLVSGSAGSGKTVLATQFLVEGIEKADEAGVFITFEESPNDIRRNVRSFSWHINEWETADRWAFVDASLQPGEEVVIAGGYDLNGLLVRIENAVKKTNAKRVAMDSLGAIFSRFSDEAIIRTELLRIATALKHLGVTAVMTAERREEYGDISRFGVEEFVADNVIILRNALEQEKRRRTLEILKFRGTNHHKGEYPFTIIPQRGIVVLPLGALKLKQRSSNVRVTSGNAKLDKMCGGGFFRDSIIMVSGATGTGKTLITTEFIAGGVNAGEKCLLFAFEESREQLFRNASGWGRDFAQMEQEGKLQVICDYPEVTGLEEHLIRIKTAIETFKPNRVAVDSLSALERISSIKGFREFVISLTSFIKHEEIAGLFTATTPTLVGGTSITETHISTITDTIILLRYVEMGSEMQRGLTILKMRGSAHDHNIHEFNIDGSGMHISAPFASVTGILRSQSAYTS